MILERYVHGKVAELISAYIDCGPTKLREDLGLDDSHWIVVFDHLVFDHNLPFKVVMKNVDFFLDLYIKNGFAHVRDVLDILDEKYDVMATLIFDFLAISNDGLEYHVMHHRDKYVAAMWEHDAEFVKKVLYISSAKYEESWAKILDILLHATCDDINDKYAFENALKAFSSMANTMREHRRINEEGLL